jgi:hypothetical protein
MPPFSIIEFRQEMLFANQLLTGWPLSLANPMRGDVKKKTLPFSPQGEGCLTCIQPNAVG